MNEVTISKNRLTGLWVAIIALLILVIFLWFRKPPLQPDNLTNFLEELNRDTTTIVATIGKDAKFAFFNKEDLSSLEPCGELKDNAIPPGCRLNGNNRVELLNLSTAAVVEVRSNSESTVVNANGKLYLHTALCCCDPQGHYYKKPNGICP